jgi:hypothetical protein
MNDDLVTRLRQPHGYNDPAGPRMREAADEIERLRVHLREASEDANAEVARLRSFVREVSTAKSFELVELRARAREILGDG